MMADLFNENERYAWIKKLKQRSTHTKSYRHINSMDANRNVKEILYSSVKSKANKKLIADNGRNMVDQKLFIFWSPVEFV